MLGAGNLEMWKKPNFLKLLGRRLNKSWLRWSKKYASCGSWKKQWAKICHPGFQIGWRRRQESLPNSFISTSWQPTLEVNLRYSMSKTLLYPWLRPGSLEKGAWWSGRPSVHWQCAQCGWSCSAQFLIPASRDRDAAFGQFWEVQAASVNPCRKLTWMKESSGCLTLSISSTREWVCDCELFQSLVRVLMWSPRSCVQSRNTGTQTSWRALYSFYLWWCAGRSGQSPGRSLEREADSRVLEAWQEDFGQHVQHAVQKGNSAKLLREISKSLGIPTSVGGSFCFLCGPICQNPHHQGLGDCKPC